MSLPKSYRERLESTFAQGQKELRKINSKWPDPFERSREQIKFYRAALPYVIQKISDILREIANEEHKA